jgi:4-hydroxy 2-oxovalerate aldolase
MPYSEELDVRLTDTSLRDGSHATRHQFTEEQVRSVVRALDAAGMPVIEVTHGDGLGGSSHNYGFSLVDERVLMKAAVDEARRAKIAALMLPGLGTKDDIKAIRDIGVSIVRIATHCTEADIADQHFGLAREIGLETVGFLMMAHTVTPDKLAEQARIMADAGCQCVYVVDSAGSMILDEAADRVAAVVASVGHDAQAASTATKICHCRSPTPSARYAPARCRSTVRPVASEPARATPAAKHSPRWPSASVSVPDSTCSR